ncbi:hypothetical protein SOVF_143170 [Spinacia oleracea]|nr:hypothetical protein SOVF_143170 [Spinacia oleracea]
MLDRVTSKSPVPDILLPVKAEVLILYPGADNLKLALFGDDRVKKLTTLEGLAKIGGSIINIQCSRISLRHCAYVLMVLVLL